jgi:bifunctional non-homologous end joining protein LigD
MRLAELQRMMRMPVRHTSQICVTVGLFLMSGLALGATRSRGPRSPEACNEILSGRSQKLPKVDPVILKPLNRLVDNPNYQFEMKYDGFRGLGYFEPGRRCRFVSRNGNHLPQFQSLCEAISQELNIQSAIFDGEVISIDSTGRPIFKKMLQREGPFQYVAFDLLWLNGQDLRSFPLETRRQKLLKILPKSSRFIVEPLVEVGSGSKLYELMVENDLEGIVVKRLTDKYSRSTKWYKFKNKNYSQAKNRGHFGGPLLKRINNI